MKKIITAINNYKLNEELKREADVEVPCKDIQYKEGILEVLDKFNNVDYIILDSELPGEINLQNLIQLIFEKNEKIKIIIVARFDKKNKIDDIENNNIIKIYYENEINLDKIKNYKKYEKIEKIKINKKILIKLKEKYIKKLSIIEKFKKLLLNNLKNKNINNNVNSKIINILGERNIGKSIIIMDLVDYIIRKYSNKGSILIIELNEENPSIYSIFGCKKFNRNKLGHDRRIKNRCITINKRLIKKYLDIKIMEKLIIKIHKNINLISYNKLLDFSNILKLKEKYNLVIIENYLIKNKQLNKKIIKCSNKNILIIKPNIIGVRNGRKIIEKNKLNEINNLEILINNYNKYSMDQGIIKNIFHENNIIGKIYYKSKYEKLINSNFNHKILIQKKFTNNIKNFLNSLIDRNHEKILDKLLKNIKL